MSLELNILTEQEVFENIGEYLVRETEKFLNEEVEEIEYNEELEGFVVGTKNSMLADTFEEEKAEEYREILKKCKEDPQLAASIYAKYKELHKEHYEYYIKEINPEETELDFLMEAVFFKDESEYIHYIYEDEDEDQMLETLKEVMLKKQEKGMTFAEEEISENRNAVCTPYGIFYFTE